MTDQSISNGGKIAIGFAIVAGLLALTRAAYLYSQAGEVDFAKLSLASASRHSFSYL